MAKNNAELYSAYKISDLLKEFKSNIQLLDVKQKRYAITGDPSFLNDLKVLENKIKTSLNEMQQYFINKPEESLFLKLKDLSYEKLVAAKDLNQQSNLAGFDGKMSNSNADTRMDAVTESINSSLDNTTRILIDDSKHYIDVSKKWSVLQIIIAILISSGALIVLLYDIGLRNDLEKKLRIEKQRADLNAEMKEQFMANMSHEIRTPMNAIIGFTHLLGKTPLNEEQLKYLHAIETGSKNLLGIINDILDFSKIEAGKLTLEKIPFSLQQLVLELRTFFENKALEKNILFEIYLDKDIPMQLIGDPIRLNQILVNLINNALKFTDRGKVSLHIHSLSKDLGTQTIQFIVRDTGIGIGPEQLNHIFERFNQGHINTSRLYGGTGLGLSIVKSLAEIQNGSITVESVIGIGSDFQVTLPFETPQAPLGDITLPRKTSLKFPQVYKVLLVEDNELNQLLASRYLEGFGCKVYLASNGKEAIDFLSENGVDIILMDLQMPEMDGYEATQLIRNHLRLKTPIIAMTAHVLPGEKEKCHAIGMDNYLTKPFNENYLFELIQKYVFAEESNTTITNQIVNFEEVRLTTRDNKKFMTEMIQLFLSQNVKDLENLNSGVNNLAYPIIKNTAHRMITSVGFMGLKPLIAKLRHIETLANKQAPIELIAAEVKELENYFSIARSEFTEELKKNS